MNCAPRWAIVVPLVLAVWGIVSERTALLMLAVVVFVVVCLRPQRGRPRARLTSVPMGGPEQTPAVGGVRLGRGEGGLAEDGPC